MRRDPWAHGDGTAHSAAGPLGCFRCANERRLAGGPVNKRPPVMTGAAAALRLLDSMPKAMLADLVVDLLRASEGEDLDGDELARQIAVAAYPVARARGWRVPGWWPRES